MFHSEIVNDIAKLNLEINSFKDIPVLSNVTSEQVIENYHHVKLDVKLIIQKEISKIKKQQL